jgi:surfeit locus 1 family protein
MLRTALRPRFVALLALALLLASVFAWLGDWQLSRARDEASREVREQAAAQPVTPLADVLAPAEPVTGEDVRRLVSARGRLDGDRVLTVPGRELHGEPGAWVLAPLVVEGTGGTLPVVLGWLPDGARPPDVETGPVELTGRLEQSEAPVGGQTPDVEQVPAVSSADLVNVWEPPLYTVYLAVTDPPGSLRPVPESEPPSGFALQNLSYALQWWAFAGFAVFFWWRIVRDAHERGQERQDTAGAGDRAPAAREQQAESVP